MPSAITHELIAQQTLSLLPAAAQIADTAPDYYYLGAQGGDLFFFYKPLSKKEGNFGKFLHRHGSYKLFSAMAEYLKEAETERTQKATAYCLGYVSHYSADVCFHPFVYNYLKAHDAKRSVHSLIENDWDVYFLRKKEGREAEHYDFAFSAEKLGKEEILYDLFYDIAPALGREEIKKRPFQRALKNFERFLHFFHGDCYDSAQGLSKIVGLKALARMYPRRTPEQDFLEGNDFFELSGGIAQNADELFNCAAGDSARRISLFLNALSGAPLPREEFNKHLLTGKPQED